MRVEGRWREGGGEVGQKGGTVEGTEEARQARWRKGWREVEGRVQRMQGRAERGKRDAWAACISAIEEICFDELVFCCSSFIACKRGEG